MAVSDHAVYSIALEIHQKHQEMFGFVAFIAKRFYDSGLGDVTIKSGVTAVGSVGSVLDGNTYKRGI